MIAALNREIKIAPSSTAIVAIDMHRGHLDMSVATMPTTPEDAERVIGNAQKLLGYARSLSVSIIHVKLVMRRLHKGGSETNNVPFWQALQKVRNEYDRLTPGRRSSVNEHNLEGSPGTEIIPALVEESDYIIDNKKRLDCFMGTDLDILLHSLGVRTVCLMASTPTPAYSRQRSLPSTSTMRWWFCQTALPACTGTISMSLVCRTSPAASVGC